jgi:hypothetical protein
VLGTKVCFFFVCFCESYRAYDLYRLHAWLRLAVAEASRGGGGRADVLTASFATVYLSTEHGKVCQGRGGLGIYMMGQM